MSVIRFTTYIHYRHSDDVKPLFLIRIIFYIHISAKDVTFKITLHQNNKLLHYGASEKYSQHITFFTSGHVTDINFKL